MSVCGVCDKEAKFIFICSECGDRFCKEHRKPEDHDCQKNQTPSEISVEEQTAPPPLESHTGDHPPEYDLDERIDLEEVLFTEKNVPAQKSNGAPTKEKKQNKRSSLVAQLNAIKTPLAIMIIASILSGALIGSLVIPSGNTDNLQQRYDTVIEYYTELQADNQKLNKVAENKDNQISSLQTELDDLSQEYSTLQSDWTSLFSDQIQYEAPSNNQLTSWLAADPTDQHTISGSYTTADQAILLSLKAKNQNFKLGVVTVYGNFTEELLEYTYNIVETEGGYVVYIDPQTDEIWWTPGYEEVSQDRVWDLGKYDSVYVTEVDTIIGP
jgi:hypothetical protein